MGWINVTISEKHSAHGFEKKVRHSIDFDRLYIRTWKEERTTEELVDSRKTRSHSRMKRFVMEFWLATNEERGNARSAVFVVSFYPSSFILVRVSSFGIVQLDTLREVRATVHKTLDHESISTREKTRANLPLPEISSPTNSPKNTSSITPVGLARRIIPSVMDIYVFIAGQTAGIITSRT